MKTNQNSSNGRFYLACLSIIIVVLVLFLSALGKHLFAMNSGQQENRGLSIENSTTAFFAAQKDVTGDSASYTKLTSNQGSRHFALLSSPRLHHPRISNAKKRIKNIHSIKRFRKTHKTKRIHLRRTVGPSRNQLFALLGSSVQMEALHYRINALTPADDSWKQRIDSLLQPYINGMEAYDSILVVGFTDNTGSIQGNLGLSEKRAKIIAAYLEAQGIPGTRIHIAAVGQECPVASNQTCDGRNTNRRVEINFLKGP